MNLDELIAEARGLANDHPCVREHLWGSVGGRSCPRGSKNYSQTVYRCQRCGEYDYGYRGGPGAADCEQPCSLSCSEGEQR